MTCPMYINGMDRRREPTVDDVCRGWGLDYNMGKAVECIRASITSDPVARLRLLEEATTRIARAQADAERAVAISKSIDVPVCADNRKQSVLPEDDGVRVNITTEPPKGTVPEKHDGDDPKDAPKADNMPDPLYLLRKAMEAANADVKPTDEEVNEMLGSIVGLLGLEVPEGVDIQTIRSMDNLVKQTLEVVSDIKRKVA